MNPLPELLPIPPFTQPVRGAVSLPGSKSITNRALLLAALCDRPVTLLDPLVSEDTRLMAEALQALGLDVRREGDRPLLRVQGAGGAIPAPSADLFVGLAGTVARFLTAWCASAAAGTYRIDGTAAMRRRPMRGLVDALRALGADIRCQGEEGHFPLEIRACGLRGGSVTIDAGESSQMLSALLMAAPLARAPVEVHLAGPVRWPFVQMTARLMEQFGQPPIEQRGDRTLRITNTARYRLEAGQYTVEPDATAAGYFLALPAVTGGRLSLRGLRRPGEGLQGDTNFQTVLEHAGLEIASLAGSAGIEAAWPPGGARQGVTQDFAGFSDTFLALAAVAPLLAGPTRITGIAHTRRQETDRVAGAARELRRLGQEVVEEEDALTITPRPLVADATIETCGDHRFAMSFAILGCHDLRGDGRPWLSIRDPACCAKTFPNFFEVLAEVWDNSHSHA
jgi:3-phosphoshikimate 1-carboxyvinyltransferase